MKRLTRAMLLLAFGLALQSAPALAAVDGDGETTFTVPLRANHGLSAKLEADDDEIQLTVKRGGEEAIYFASGEVSAEGIAVTFGDFGEFDVSYQPFRTLETRGPNRHCTGDPRTTTQGFFTGTLRFRGEHGYVSIEATRAKGTLVLQPEWDCDYGRARTSRARGNGSEEEEDATLVATARDPKIQFLAIGSRRQGKRPSSFFLAFSQEIRQGVGIDRVTLAGTRSAAFDFDNDRGTATVDPPAPYGGSAHYRRRLHAPDRWSGSLTVPLLGLGRVRLAAPGFHARMLPRLPDFE